MVTCTLFRPELCTHAEDWTTEGIALTSEHDDLLTINSEEPNLPYTGMPYHTPTERYGHKFNLTILAFLGSTGCATNHRSHLIKNKETSICRHQCVDRRKKGDVFMSVD